MRCLRLLRNITLLFFIYSTFIACNVQKRRYSHGLYFGKHQTVSTKTVNHEIKKESINSIVRLNHINKLEDKSEKVATLIKEPEVLAPQSKFSKKIKKLNHFVVNDTIKKSKIPENVPSINHPNKKMEFFSKLALGAYIINVTFIFLFLILSIIFSEVLLLLFAACIIISVLLFLLAIIGFYSVKKNPDRYKDSSLASFLIIYSLFLALLAFIFVWITSFFVYRDRDYEHL